ncbi:MAG: ISL3 family transposase, partial [Planctomycetaceae bacterium]|nr:ISL3 family transposase [Planctomycetaceae bacterium]
MDQINLPLDIASLEIIAQSVDSKGNIILDVQSKKTETPCHKCGKPATKRYGTAPSIKIRHLPILDTPVYLRIKPVRYQCKDCEDHPTTSEQYDWCDRGSSVTKGLEKYLLRSLIHSTVQDVSRKEGLGYKALTSSLNRQIHKSVNWSEYRDLETLGIDEITMKKGHDSYVTIVSVRTKSDALSVIGVLPDRRKETVKAFFDSIPSPLRKTVKTVCTDMYEGFVQAAKEVFGAKAVVIDRYHVAKLYRAPLDQLRIREMKRLKTDLSPEEYAKLEGMMWILRKNHECLSKKEKEALSLLYQHSPQLKKAHQYALKLTSIFNSHCSRKNALAKVDRWISRVEKSEIRCFDRFIIALKRHKFSIANYFKDRKNSGFVEGLNNKIKVAKRRCYGFFKNVSLFQRLQLDLKGFQMFGIQ